MTQIQNKNKILVISAFVIFLCSSCFRNKVDFSLKFIDVDTSDIKSLDNKVFVMYDSLSYEKCISTLHDNKDIQAHGLFCYNEIISRQKENYNYTFYHFNTNSQLRTKKTFLINKENKWFEKIDGKYYLYFSSENFTNKDTIKHFYEYDSNNEVEYEKWVPIKTLTINNELVYVFHAMLLSKEKIVEESDVFFNPNKGIVKKVFYNENNLIEIIVEVKN